MIDFVVTLQFFRITRREFVSVYRDGRCTTPSHLLRPFCSPYPENIFFVRNHFTYYWQSDIFRYVKATSSITETLSMRWLCITRINGIHVIDAVLMTSHDYFVLTLNPADDEILMFVSCPLKFNLLYVDINRQTGCTRVPIAIY